MLFVDINKQFRDRLDFELNLLMIGLNFDALLSRENGFFGVMESKKLRSLAGW